MSYFPRLIFGFGASGSVPSDSDFADVELLMHCDGTNGSSTFTDSGPDARTITRSGNAQISTANSKFGGASMLLDGTGDYVSIGAAADWTWMHATNAKWTLEMQLRLATFSQPHALFSTAEGTTGHIGVFAYVNTDRSISVQIVRGVLGTYVVNALYPAGSYPNDTADFHQLSICWDHSLASANLELFIDAVSLGTVNKTANAPSGAEPTKTLRIGSYNISGEDLNGNIDEVRITSVVRAITTQTAPFPDA